jgi:hypothetical protein
VIAILLAGVQLCCVPQEAAAQAERVHTTIRAALEETGFAQAASAPGARHLDEPLTSWEYGSTPDYFVAGYYLKREVKDQFLGPLYISVFRRQANIWVHATGLDDDSGSVLDVNPYDRYALISLHHNPSAGGLLVVDASTARVVARLRGFFPRMLSGDVVLFTGNMTHFAPEHKEQLMAFDPETGETVEVFPGVEATALEIEYQQARQAQYDGLPKAARDKFEKEQDAPDDWFDRDVDHVAQSPDTGRLAFVVRYSSEMRREPWPIWHTVVTCGRRPAGAWACAERRLADASRETGILVRAAPNGGFNREDLDALIQALLKRQ